MSSKGTLSVTPTNHPIAGMDDQDCVDDHHKSFDTGTWRRAGSRCCEEDSELRGFSGRHRVGIGCDEVHLAQVSLQAPGCRRL